MSKASWQIRLSCIRVPLGSNYGMCLGALLFAILMPPAETNSASGISILQVKGERVRHFPHSSHDSCTSIVSGALVGEGVGVSGSNSGH